MHHYIDAITDTKGNALIGYFVRCVDAVTGVGASLYADTSLTPILSISGVANAAQVDSDGNADFYIAGGTYHLDIYATDSTSFVRRIPNIEMIDANVAAGRVASRTVLASIVAASGDCRDLTETGREGTFMFSTANLSTFVAADTSQGLYVAPASDTTGASGAWKRLWNGAQSWLNWFGATRDSSGAASANLTSYNCALAVLALLGTAPLSGAAYHGAPELHAFGRYYFSNQLVHKLATYSIIGYGAGLTRNDGAATEFVFPNAGSHGLVFDDYKTIGGVYDLSVVKSATNSKVSRIFVRGPSSGSGSYDGIHTNARIIVEHCCGNGWARAGCAITANNSATDSTSGNANKWEVIGGRWEYNGVAGLYVEGADANAGRSAGVDTSFNGQYGIFDNSFLGNTHVAPHAEWNGLQISGYEGTTTNVGCNCAQGGHYYSVQPGQAASASTNAPPAGPYSSAYWQYFGDGAANSDIPAYSNGMALREGGAYYLKSTVAGTIVVGGYVEGSQSPAKGNSPAQFIGGSLTGGVGGTAIRIENVSGLMSVPGFQTQYVGSGGTTKVVIGGANENRFAEMYDEGGHSWFWTAAGGFLHLQDNQGGNGNPIVISTPGDGANFGRSSAQYGVLYSGALAIGYYNSGRIVDMGAAAPTTGNHAAGEIVFNNAPSAGGKIGWVCTAAGTPGTWKPFGVIDA